MQLGASIKYVRVRTEGGPKSADLQTKITAKMRTGGSIIPKILWTYLMEAPLRNLHNPPVLCMADACNSEKFST